MTYSVHPDMVSLARHCFEAYPQLSFYHAFKPAYNTSLILADDVEKERRLPAVQRLLTWKNKVSPIMTQTSLDAIPAASPRRKIYCGYWLTQECACPGNCDPRTQVRISKVRQERRLEQARQASVLPGEEAPTRITDTSSDSIFYATEKSLRNALTIVIDGFIKKHAQTGKRPTRTYITDKENRTLWPEGVQPSRKQLYTLMTSYHIDLKTLVNERLALFVLSREKK